MGNAHCIQTGNSNLLYLCSRPRQLLKQVLAYLNHVRRCMFKPGLVDSQGYALEISLVPAIECDSRLMQRVGLHDIRASHAGIRNGRILDCNRQRPQVRHTPA